MQLDELKLRKPDFQGGRSVELADGQEWFLPLLIVDLVPDRLPSGLYGVRSSTQFGPDFDRMVDDFRASENAADEAATLFEVGAFLLRVNYDIDDAALCQLFRYRLGPDSPGEAMSAIADIALGRAPKP